MSIGQFKPLRVRCSQREETTEASSSPEKRNTAQVMKDVSNNLKNKIGKNLTEARVINALYRKKSIDTAIGTIEKHC